MTISHSQVTITTSPTLIHTADGDADSVHIHDPGGGQSVFIGTASVTTSNGFELEAGAGDLVFELDGGDKVYGIVASTTQDISVFVVS